MVAHLGVVIVERTNLEKSIGLVFLIKKRKLTFIYPFRRMPIKTVTANIDRDEKRT